MPCLVLYGDSGMGKTMIVEKFERMHPAHHDKNIGTETRPVVIFQMPPCPDERRFFVRILNAVGAPYWEHEGLAWLADRAQSWPASYRARCWPQFFAPSAIIGGHAVAVH